MKLFKRLLIVATLTLFVALPSSAQFSFGLKAGVAVNDLYFNANTFNSNNCVGFTGGAMVQFMLPFANLGLDASVMYVHRTSDVYYYDYNDPHYNQFYEGSNNRDYIDIPINLKWMIGIPGAGQYFSPYLFTGPSFSFLISDSDFEYYEQKGVDIAWNLGFGFQFFKKIQIGASYGWGLTEAIQGHKERIDGKNRYWTVTAAYLF